MQALAHVPAFASLLMDCPGLVHTTPAASLARQAADLVRRLWAPGPDSVVPDGFVRLVRALNRTFAGYGQQVCAPLFSPCAAGYCIDLYTLCIARCLSDAARTATS